MSQILSSSSARAELKDVFDAPYSTGCAIQIAMRIEGPIKSWESNDKQKHCALSCVVSTFCGISGTLIVGGIKEIGDIFGPGNAEWEDFRADTVGAQLGQELKRTGTFSIANCQKACTQVF